MIITVTQNPGKVGKWAFNDRKEDKDKTKIVKSLAPTTQDAAHHRCLANKQGKLRTYTGT